MVRCNEGDFLFSNLEIIIIGCYISSAHLNLLLLFFPIPFFLTNQTLYLVNIFIKVVLGESWGNGTGSGPP
jgi:hypothetical protein